MDDERLARIEAKLDGLHAKLDRLLEKPPEQAGLKLKGVSNRKSGAPPSGAFLYLQAKMADQFKKDMHGQAYAFGGHRDAGAIKKLMTCGLTVDEILNRWSFALRTKQCAEIWLFQLNLNKFVPRSGRAPRLQILSEKTGDLYAEKGSE